MPIDWVHQRTQIYQSLYQVIPEPPEMLAAWTNLVAKYQITGFRVHDVRYVAMMQLCRISHLMTYNVKHYQRFPITIVDPAAF
ncbi:MAG: hypothetical protein FWD61_09285 [Phycisphaerales bacterium]|nr:hypothetical protein [Phycisphaerales bacterium]